MSCRALLVLYALWALNNDSMRDPPAVPVNSPGFSQHRSTAAFYTALENPPRACVFPKTLKGRRNTLWNVAPYEGMHSPFFVAPGRGAAPHCLSLLRSSGGTTR